MCSNVPRNEKLHDLIVLQHSVGFRVVNRLISQLLLRLHDALIVRVAALMADRDADLFESQVIIRMHMIEKIPCKTCARSIPVLNEENISSKITPKLYESTFSS